MSAAGSAIARHRIVAALVALVLVVAIVGLGFVAGSDHFGGGHRDHGGTHQRFGDHANR